MDERTNEFAANWIEHNMVYKYINVLMFVTHLVTHFVVIITLQHVFHYQDQEHCQDKCQGPRHMSIAQAAPSAAAPKPAQTPARQSRPTGHPAVVQLHSRFREKKRNQTASNKKDQDIHDHVLLLMLFHHLHPLLLCSSFPLPTEKDSLSQDGGETRTSRSAICPAI